MEQSGEKKEKVVMVAIDESECSRYALEWVFKNLLDSIINSELVILTVQPISDYSYLAASSMGATPPELLRSFQQQQENIATALLEKAKQMCNNHGVSATTVVKVGDPKETICESVECFGATLLVLGSRGRGALKRAFSGECEQLLRPQCQVPSTCCEERLKEYFLCIIPHSLS